MRALTLALRVWVSFGYSSLYRRLHTFRILRYHSLRWIGPKLKAARRIAYRSVDCEDSTSQLARHSVISISGRGIQVPVTHRTLSLTAMTL